MLLRKITKNYTGFSALMAKLFLQENKNSNFTTSFWKCKIHFLNLRHLYFIHIVNQIHTNLCSPSSRTSILFWTKKGFFLLFFSFLLHTPCLWQKYQWAKWAQKRSKMFQLNFAKTRVNNEMQTRKNLVRNSMLYLSRMLCLRKFAGLVGPCRPGGTFLNQVGTRLSM